MIVKLLTEHDLDFLSLKGGCTGSSESTLVKMSHCWEAHVAAQIYLAMVFCLFPKDVLRSVIYSLLAQLSRTCSM